LTRSVSSKYFVKLPKEIEISRKFALKNRNFLPGSMTLQISKHIDATCDP